MKHWTKIITMLLLAVLLAGCGQKERESYAFSAAVVGKLTGFDPAMAASEGEEIAAAHLYENLVRLRTTEDGTEVVGALARSWECTANLDGTETYVFHLRGDAKWSDGRGVWASDFVYAWQHLADEATGSPRAALLDMVAGYEEARRGDPDALQVRARDRNTLEVVLRCRCPYFLRSVCTVAATMPRRADLPDRSGPVTNGAYQLESFEDGVLTMTASGNYYDRERLGPDTVTIHYCDTAEEAAALWDEGAVDFVCGVGDEAMAEEGDWLREPRPETAVLIVNQMTEQLDNEPLRQALSLAIDRTKLAELRGAALHMPASGLIPDGITSSDGSDFRSPESIHIDNSDFAFNCEQARELLTRSGVTRLADLTLLCTEEERAVAEEICRGWQEELGLTVRPRSVAAGELSEALTGGAFHIALITCRADRNDAEPMLQTWQSGHAENYAQFHSSAYDMLLRVAAASSSAEARDAYLSDAERLLVEQGSVMPLWFTNSVYRVKSGLAGLSGNGLGVFCFDSVRPTA